VLVGGFAGGRYLATAEVFSTSGGCPHALAPLPHRTYSPILVVVDASRTLLACGGRREFGAVGRTCLRYQWDQSRWRVDADVKLLRDRHGAAQSVDGRGKVYLR